jgi:hypothetical protein
VRFPGIECFQIELQRTLERQFFADRFLHS